jgi:tetratricopeptide (TPR) repeat protein
MKSYFTLLLFPIVLLTACSSGDKLTRLSDEGMIAFKKGDYEAALEIWEPLIVEYRNSDREAECPLYGKTGRAALQLGLSEKGQEYIQQAIYYKSATPEDVAMIAEEYRRIDNLSREIEALETFNERFPGDERINDINARLFETYIRSENWEPAIDLWPELPEETRSSAGFMEGYFTANMKTGNDIICEEYAGKILEVDKDNITALEYKAKKYYDLAENLYQSEMKAYENNKTNKQYAQLLKAFETVTKDFKTSLNYFLKLYELEPSPDYAKYLANIYARLDDKKKSEYYMGLIK